jgi:hypothetical protein
MIVRKLKTDAAVQQILDVLNKSYAAKHPHARVDAYRHDKYSVRLRIIDPDFRKFAWSERINLIWPMLEKELPEETLGDIWFYLFLTPEEAKRSATNMEFEDPSPTD